MKLKGDVNNDYDIDARDVMLVLGHLNSYLTLKDDALDRANVNNSSGIYPVNTEDLLLLKLHVNGVRAITEVIEE